MENYMEIKPEKELISQISMKDVWKNDTNRVEEKCMSPFIKDHINDISVITDRELEVVDMEVFVGDFRADIICKDTETNDIVIVENQLDRTDHDHIGKAITYLSNLDAKVIVWICQEARPEHIKAIEKLNEITTDDYSFYLLELNFKSYINDTKNIMYSFNKKYAPFKDTKIANEIKVSKSEEFNKVNSFLYKFIEKIKEKVPTARFNKTQTYHKIYNIGKFWSLISISPKTHITTFEIGIDCGRATKNGEKDKKYYEDILNNLKDKLNSEYGYTFNYTIGSRNSDYIKILYDVDSDENKENNMDKYEEVSVNIMNEMKKIIKN